MKYLGLTCLFLYLMVIQTYGQENIFIPDNGFVYAFSEDTVTIFGNLFNSGHFGTSTGAVINFFGVRWENNAKASLPGDQVVTGAAGGLFRFRGSSRQILSSGYHLADHTGPSFPNISIENKSGIRLKDNDLYIRGSLHFHKGQLYLNGQSLLIDDSITGYSKDRFIVISPSINDGSLFRKAPNVRKLLVFPIGTAPESYSPLGIKTTSSHHLIGASVFNHVYENADQGEITDSDFVRKTWELKNVQGDKGTLLFLQHHKKDEGVRFTPLHDSSYISLYSIEDNQWDIDSTAHTINTPGRLTTDNFRKYTYLNDRIFKDGLPFENKDSISWLSISTKPYNGLKCPVTNFSLWEAQRYNYNWVQLFWRTHLEMNVSSYEIQRRRDSSNHFKTIAIRYPKNNNGFSNHLHNYYYADTDPYKGWTYFRLKIKGSKSCVVYTTARKVPWHIDVKVWPNPSPGEVHVKVNGTSHPVILQIVNMLGQVIRQYSINSHRVITMNDLQDATYFFILRDPKNNYQKLKTIKLIVQRTR